MNDQFPENHPLPHEDELLLQSYLDGELTQAARAAFEARLLNEPALRRALESWQALFDHLAGAGVPELERDLAPEILQTLQPTSLIFKKLERLAMLQMAITLLIGVLAWPLWYFSRPGLAVSTTLSGLIQRFIARGVSLWEELGMILLVDSLFNEWWAWLSAVSTNFSLPIPLSLPLLLALSAAAVLVWLISSRFFVENRGWRP